MCRGSFCSIHRTTEAWPPPEKVKSIGFQTKWRYIPFVFNNFHIHAFLGTKPTYDWWLGESSLDVWVDGFKRPDWTYILASQRAALGTYIFQHQRGCGFPFMERRSFFFAWRKLKMLVPVLPIEQVLANLFLDCMWEFDLKVLLW